MDVMHRLLCAGHPAGKEGHVPSPARARDIADKLLAPAQLLSFFTGITTATTANVFEAGNRR